MNQSNGDAKHQADCVNAAELALVPGLKKATHTLDTLDELRMTRA